MDITFVATESHSLWGGAVEVHSHGTEWGDWSLANLKLDEDHHERDWLETRLGATIRGRGCRIYAPNPSEFNGQIALPRDLRDEVLKDFRRGARADGVLLTEPNQAFAVSSGDCPTVIMRNVSTGAVVAAHAGRDSLIKEDGGLIRQMVTALTDAGGSRRDVRAFIACGIGSEHFVHPVHDPVNGERNRRLRDKAAAYAGAAHANDPDGRISLFHLITGQLVEQGVREERIGFDGADTYSDLGPDGKPLWHSHRRGDRTRNLVLVIRRR